MRRGLGRLDLVGEIVLAQRIQIEYKTINLLALIKIHLTPVIMPLSAIFSHQLEKRQKVLMVDIVQVVWNI